MPEQRDRSFRLNLEVYPDNPNLLIGLDRWLELGLIDVMAILNDLPSSIVRMNLGKVRCLTASK
jgi:hypothetical protein